MSEYGELLYGILQESLLGLGKEDRKEVINDLIGYRDWEYSSNVTRWMFDDVIAKFFEEKSD
jgi:hypothetical protein